eukprot:292751-Pelagomonas_calceolata.AAC.2
MPLARCHHNDQPGGEREKCLHSSAQFSMSTGDEPPSLTTSTLEMSTLMALSQKEQHSMFAAAQR